MTTAVTNAEKFISGSASIDPDALLHMQALISECELLAGLAIKALDDLDAEAEAFASLENAQTNFSRSNVEARAYGIAMVRASKSSKAQRDAAMAALKEITDFTDKSSYCGALRNTACRCNTDCPIVGVVARARAAIAKGEAL